MANDLISRSALLAELYEARRPPDYYLDMPEREHEKYRIWRNGVEFAVQNVLAAPAVDAVEVVRCIECRFNAGNEEIDPLCMNDYTGRDIVCTYWETDGLEQDDFCSYGERKGERRC